uniref:Chalcone-flavonone isomerase family protein n=1 Tax=Kalanchoe fedtschenkoi TaxID=63787 RepID=A0A7N0ZZW6_KALFE
MAAAAAIDVETHHPLASAIQVENLTFPAKVEAPPGSKNAFILGGAGVRGLEIQGRFIKFTAIGVYLEDGEALKALGGKWSRKTAEELLDSSDFYLDIVTGPFEKFTQVTTILPLTGQQYSEKVAENCVAYWKSIGSYMDAEEKAVDKFLQVFKDENFPPGSSILFTQSPHGSLTIGFSKHDEIPKEGNAVIDNKQLSEAVLESIIGQKGVSPEAKKSLATRLAELFKEKHGHSEENEVASGKPEPEKSVAPVDGDQKPSEQINL